MPSTGRSGVASGVRCGWGCAGGKETSDSDWRHKIRCDFDLRFPGHEAGKVADGVKGSCVGRIRTGVGRAPLTSYSLAFSFRLDGAVPHADRVSA